MGPPATALAADAALTAAGLLAAALPSALATALGLALTGWLAAGGELAGDGDGAEAPPHALSNSTPMTICAGTFLRTEDIISYFLS